MKPDPLLENFKKFFTIIYANTEQLRKHVYKIRYDVFCDELRLEENCPINVEKDGFDEYAHHFLIQHKISGIYAGTVRFILPPKDTGSLLLLPFEKYCSSAIDKNIINPFLLDQGTYGEVSRLAVPANFRKRAGEQGKSFIMNDTPAPPITDDDKRHFPLISVGLYLTSTAFFVLKEIDYIFVMAEPRLARCMARLGIRFDQAGEVTDYHGQRAPFYLSQEKFATHLKPAVKPLFNHIKDELVDQLMPLAILPKKAAI